VADQDVNNIKMAANALKDHFGKDGLDALIWDVFGYDAEPTDFGKTKQIKIRIMLKKAIEQDLFWELINAARKERPHGLWPMDTGPLA
jgi:hypothetical protein